LNPFGHSIVVQIIIAAVLACIMLVLFATVAYFMVKTKDKGAV
jgi:ABC-type multidrug transport system permease subunit